MTKIKGKKWTASDIKKHYDEKGLAMSDEISSLVDSLGLQKFVSSPSPTKTKSLSLEVLKEEVNGIVDEKILKRGSKGSVIRGSLKTAMIYSGLKKDSEGAVDRVIFWFDGARLLTVNEMFAFLQSKGKKFEMFGYKKESRKLISRAALLLPRDSGVAFSGFKGRVKIRLFRRGKNLVDMDSLPVMFKYLIDSLKKEKIIVDDNPNVVVEYELLQDRGDFPAIGMMIERVDDWEDRDLSNLKGIWFEE